jgi:hypothetical protein
MKSVTERLKKAEFRTSCGQAGSLLSVHSFDYSNEPKLRAPGWAAREPALLRHLPIAEHCRRARVHRGENALLDFLTVNVTGGLDARCRNMP